MHGAQDGRAVVGHRDVLPLGPRHDRLQDLVHALGPQGRLDQVPDRDRAHEVGDFGYFAFQFLSLVF